MVVPFAPDWGTGIGNSPPAKKLASWPLIVTKRGSANSRAKPSVSRNSSAVVTSSILAKILLSIPAKLTNKDPVSVARPPPTRGPSPLTPTWPKKFSPISPTARAACQSRVESRLTSANFTSNITCCIPSTCSRLVTACPERPVPCLPPSPSAFLGM